MARAEAIVRVQSLDGTWQTLGVDQARGIVPEGITYRTDDRGPASAAFNVKRDPGVPWPDLTAFTPVEIWVGGVKVWSGRVSQTPTSDSPGARAISVQCEGWQFHLDDDVIEAKYVLARLADWQSSHGGIDADLTKYTVKGSPSVDGVIALGWSNGDILAAGERTGVQLDLGPYNTAKRIVITWESSNNAGTISCEAKAGTGPNPLDGSYITGFSFLNNSAASGTTSATFATAKRYVALYLVANSGSTLGADVWVKIKTVQVFSDTAYESGNASVLKASQVITDVISKAAPLLSTDTSQITTSGFSIPDYAPDEFRTPRAHIEAVNTYENMIAMVDVDQRMVFANRPAAPTLEVGAWSGGAFEDASANSGQDIYNRVIVEGAGPDGEPLRADRAAASIAEIADIRISGPSYPVTPGTGQTTGGGVTTSVSAGTGYTYLKGRSYVVAFTVSVASGTAEADLRFGDTATGPGTNRGAITGITVTTTPTVYRVVWVPSSNVTSATAPFFSLTNSVGSPNVSWSFGYIQFTSPTLADRRAFRRGIVVTLGSPMTLPGGFQIADKYLTNHRYTPLKGSLRVTGNQAVRTVLGGQAVHPAHLGLSVNQMIRLSHRVDTDTGGHGKDATIVAVDYDHDTETASIALDNVRDNFSALLARRDANVGQVTQ